MTLLGGWDLIRGSDRCSSRRDRASEDPASQRTYKPWSTMRRDSAWTRPYWDLPSRLNRRNPTTWRFQDCQGHAGALRLVDQGVAESAPHLPSQVDVVF